MSSVLKVVVSCVFFHWVLFVCGSNGEKEEAKFSPCYSIMSYQKSLYIVLLFVIGYHSGFTGSMKKCTFYFIFEDLKQDHMERSSGLKSPGLICIEPSRMPRTIFQNLNLFIMF